MFKIDIQPLSVHANSKVACVAMMFSIYELATWRESVSAVSGAAISSCSKIMILVFGLLFFCGFAKAAESQDCEVRLKPSDGFKELSEMLECLQQRIQNLEGKDARVSRPYKPSEFVGQATSGIFLFEIDRCGRSGSNIACTMYITAQGADGILLIGDKSSIFDDKGRKGKIDALTYAGEMRKLNRDYPFIREIPVKAKICFRGL
jgi:hypothetical protein